MDSAMQDRFAALVAPAANRTWEALTLLPNTSDESDVVTVSFPRPALIIGVYPSVSRASIGAGAGLLVPSLDDLLVDISLNDETRLTNRFDVVTSPSGVARVMVTMGAFRDTTGGARMMNVKLAGKTNELLVQFRWKAPALKASYESVNLGMAFHAMFTDE